MLYTGFVKDGNLMAESPKPKSEVCHINDFPTQELKQETIRQIIYNNIKDDPCLSQSSSNMLPTAYSILHNIDYIKYIKGVLEKDRNIISLMAIETVNALSTAGIYIQVDDITILFL